MPPTVSIGCGPDQIPDCGARPCTTTVL
uniref:Uncharacterized protein n=1 Tax=Anguilla anguilla TaxID=7936 RepID=A0A0E9UBT3_ANGAN